jgi:nucleoside-triphosphatase THEP1
MTGPRIGLLSGPVGVGKTTIAERVVGLARRQGLVCGGVLAPAMTDSSGSKTGVEGLDIRSGERWVLARTDRELGGPAVGAYSFDAAALDRAVATIEGALGTCDLLVVDEIGKLELWHGIGLAPVLPRLAAGEAGRSLVLVRDFLLSELQARLQPREQIVFVVSEEYREVMPPRVLRGLV